MFLLFIIGFMLAWHIYHSGKINSDDSIVVKRKQCPPHQWFWQAVVDQNGEKVGERIVCKVCGPFRG